MSDCNVSILTERERKGNLIVYLRNVVLKISLISFETIPRQMLLMVLGNI